MDRQSTGPRSHRALVTGGSRGLGAAIAEALAQAGCRILLNYRANHPAAEAVAARIRASGGAVDLLPFDVADAQASAQALRGLDLYRDPVDIVVNNAGIVRDGPFAGMKQPDWDAVIRTNLDSFYNVTQPLVLPMARKRWGRIISIVSRSGLNGHRGQVNYSAAKAGLVGATKALARELATRNITVNAVCPGLFATDMLAGIDVEALRQRIALGRLGQAAELAEAVRFLASDEASYITGHVLVVDGGLQL